MEVQYLQVVSGKDLEELSHGGRKDKLATYLKKKYVFMDRYTVPKKPGRMAHRKLWEQYEFEMKKIGEHKARMKEVRESGKYIIYRGDMYVVSINNDSYYVLSCSNEKEPVMIEDVLHSERPQSYAGRHVQGMPDNIFVPFFGRMYVLSFATGDYKAIN